MSMSFTREVAHVDLEVRVRARAVVLALRPDLAPADAAEELVALVADAAGAVVAVRRARARLEAAYAHHPRARTERAIAALGLAHLALVDRRTRGADDGGLP